MDDEKACYHAIALGAGGSYVAIMRQKKTYTTWQEAYGTGGGDSNADPRERYEELGKQKISLILRENPDFPELLREIPHPPFGIYVKGVLPERGTPTLAIVGTRRATPDGKSTARRFSSELSRAGFAIASGLAFGIDAAAHEGCLNAEGRTIAVLACGLADVYPKNHASLAEKILAQGGALVSEYPPDLPALPHRFLERNRIVSGLSKGVLVVESPERSGSLATARFALEQNRDVFAVPGPITHPNFKGSHALIRQGAMLAAKPEHILEEYGITPKDNILKIAADASPEEKLVLSALRETASPTDIDKIIDLTKLEPRIANQTVSFLLIKGTLKEDGGGYVVN